IVFEIIYIDQRQDGAFDDVLQSLVRQNTKRKPAPLPILNISLFYAFRVDHFQNHLLQVGYVDIWPDVGDRPSHVRQEETEPLPSPGGNTPNSQVASQHNHRNINATEQINQVSVGFRQFEISIV